MLIKTSSFFSGSNFPLRCQIFWSDSKAILKDSVHKIFFYHTRSLAERWKNKRSPVSPRLRPKQQPRNENVPQREFRLLRSSNPSDKLRSQSANVVVIFAILNLLRSFSMNKTERSERLIFFLSHNRLENINSKQVPLSAISRDNDVRIGKIVLKKVFPCRFHEVMHVESSKPIRQFG